MELRQIRYFVQVAKLRSFSKASTTLNVSQPALSKQIKQLEYDLSAQLLHRTTRGVSLTAAGETLLKDGEKLLQHGQRVRDKVAQAAQTPSGEVCVAFPPSLAKVARALLNRCQRDYPNIQLHLIEGLSIFLEEWLTLGRIDIAIMSGTAFREGFMLSRIGQEKFYLVGHPTASWAKRSSLKLEEVSQLDLVTTRGFRNTIDQAIASSGYQLRYRYEVDSISLLKELISEGKYATLLPSIVIRQEGFGRLAVIDVTDPEVTRSIVMAMNPISQANFAHRSVRGALEAELKTFLGEAVIRPDHG